MKSGPNYRMSKSGKIYLAHTWNRPHKASRRRSVIQGELYGSVVTKHKREREN
jgi:hypothetical protein